VPAVRQSFCAHEECAALTAGEFIRIDPRKRPTVGGVWRFSAATPRGKHGDQASDLYEFDGFEGSISKGPLRTAKYESWSRTRWAQTIW
jgi:hypothetical protein